MKMRNKGKVFPSPSSSSMSSCTLPSKDSISVLKLLPATILALISALTVQDQEVLAYMITMSMKSTNPSSNIDEKKQNTKKPNTHKPPLFDCECFDCYTSFWFRWDSSPNRELIHQAIEAYEEHLASDEKSKRNARGKRREKMGRRREREDGVTEVEDVCAAGSPENDATPVGLPEKDEGVLVVEEEKVEVGDEFPEEEVVVAPPEASAAVVVRSSAAAADNHKGLVRKVLPDVVGLLNSRLWGLWSPNV